MQKFQNIVIWGRHHALTRFQENYISKLAHQKEGMTNLQQKVQLGENPRFIFAINSANHEFTKRNPLPLWMRTAQISAFAQNINAEIIAYPVEDVGKLPGNEFAQYTIDSIRNNSFGLSEKLDPDNTLILGSTLSVTNQFRNLGYQILPAERNYETGELTQPIPFELVKDAYMNPNLDGDFFKKHAHPVTKRIWKEYNIGHKIQELFSDITIGEDAEFTETLNLWPYLEGMDQNMQFKWEAVHINIPSGRIGDVGCAAGSLIKLLTQEDKHKSSKFYGIDGSRSMITACEQRVERGHFGTPHVHFRRKNAFVGKVFEDNDMDAIHTGSTTHEVISRGGIEALKDFLRFRFEELRRGGILVNRDVIGPDEGERLVYVNFNSEDGRNHDYARKLEDKEALGKYLQGVSTEKMFERFVTDFNPAYENHVKPITEDNKITHDGKIIYRLPIRTVMEFGFQNPWRSNWMSESEETLTAITPKLWESLAQEIGFEIDPSSKYEINKWVAENHFKGQIDMYKDGTLTKQYNLPPTHMTSVLRKPE